jgi:hypothetical protein
LQKGVKNLGAKLVSVHFLSKKRHRLTLNRRQKMNLTCAKNLGKGENISFRLMEIGPHLVRVENGTIGTRRGGKATTWLWREVFEEWLEPQTGAQKKLTH